MLVGEWCPLEGTTAGCSTPVKTPSPGVVDKEARADRLNPLTMSQMPSDSSQKNSGMVAMTCHPPSLDDPEQDGDPRSDDQGTTDETQHCHGPWHKARPVHQVAQYQPVADADDEAGP